MMMLLLVVVVVVFLLLRNIDGVMCVEKVLQLIGIARRRGSNAVPQTNRPAIDDDRDRLGALRQFGGDGGQSVAIARIGHGAVPIVAGQAVRCELRRNAAIVGAATIVISAVVVPRVVVIVIGVVHIPILDWKGKSSQGASNAWFLFLLIESGMMTTTILPRRFEPRHSMIHRHQTAAYQNANDTAPAHGSFLDLRGQLPPLPGPKIRKSHSCLLGIIVLVVVIFTYSSIGVLVVALLSPECNKNPMVVWDKTALVVETKPGER